MIRGITQTGFIKRINRAKTLLMLTHLNPVISHTAARQLQPWSTQAYAPAPRPYRIKKYPAIIAWQTKFTVPDVRGQTLGSAQAQLTSRGFPSTQVLPSVSTSYPYNTVGVESPAAGSIVPSGTTVQLTLSLGPTITMPDFTGFTLNDATVAIGQLPAFLQSVIYEDQIYPFPEVPRGTVIGQYPLPNTAFTADILITLFVSSGRVYIPTINESVANDPAQVVGSTVYP